MKVGTNHIHLLSEGQQNVGHHRKVNLNQHAQSQTVNY